MAHAVRSSNSLSSVSNCCFKSSAQAVRFSTSAWRTQSPGGSLLEFPLNAEGALADGLLETHRRCGPFFQFVLEAKAPIYPLANFKAHVGQPLAGDLQFFSLIVRPGPVIWRLRSHGGGRDEPIRVTNATLWRKVSRELGNAAQLIAKHRQQMGWFETAGRDFVVVALVHCIDEGPIPFGGGVKMRTEGAVDEWVDHIAIGKEEMEMESLQQQGKDVLRSNAFEALNRAIPALVELFIAIELDIEAVRGRKLAPEFVNYIDRFRPALVAVAAYHVGDEKAAAGTKASLYLIEKPLQIDDVMKGLNGDDRIVFAGGIPRVEIGSTEVHVRGEPGSFSGETPPFQHGRVQFETIQSEVVTFGLQRLSKLQLQIAIACAETHEAGRGA